MKPFRLTKNNYWYNTKFIIKNNNFGKTTVSIIDYIYCSRDQFNEGLYLTHWKKGDKIISKDNSKKVSDVFINNKVSIIDKYKYPILRDSNNNILWIPKIANNLTQCNKDIKILWINNA